MSIGKLGLIKCGSNIQQCPTLAEMTADATATAEQIDEGATAYVRGQKITGTRASKIDVANNKIKFAYSLFGTVPSVFDFSNVEDLSNMFRECYGISSIPTTLNFSKIKNGESAFSGNSMLNISLGDLLLTNATNLNNFFYYSAIKSINSIAAPNVTTANLLFSNCDKLQSVGDLELLSVESSKQFFNCCVKLQSVGNINMPLLNDALGFFYECSSLSSIAGFNFTSLINSDFMFYKCSSLVHFRNTTIISCSLSFADSPLLDSGDVEYYVLGELADLTGETSQTITFNTALQGAISESAIQAATDKNWIVNFADNM